MLKYIRIVIAVISIILVSLLFLDFTGTAARHWGWMAKIQFIPAVLSLNILIIVLLIAATLIFGRLYCSVVCPLGIFQDVVARIRRFVKGKKGRNPYKYHRDYRHIRYTVFTLFVVFLLLGLTNFTAAALAGLLEPYSEYGRIASQLFGPIYDGGENLLAQWSESHDNYLFTPVAHATSIPLLIVASLTAIVVAVCAWTSGRDYCNAVCPVGTFLGILSRYSRLKPVINTDLCNGCRKCERNCKSHCIDARNHKIDCSRCVVCFDCINNCAQHAISYKHRPKLKIKQGNNDIKLASAAEGSTTRRQFIATSAIIAGSLATKAVEHGDGALAPVKLKKSHIRDIEVTPAGSKGILALTSQCTACQLCIRSCPEGVLRPSTDLSTFMQPVMKFEKSYCRPECTVCGTVCPTSAIESVTVEQKSSIKTGTAVVDPTLCISAAAGQHCGLCSRSCPTAAIEMVKIDGNLRPVVNEAACIGCGSCEYHCPVGTSGHIRSDVAAIHVEGIEVHREI